MTEHDRIRMQRALNCDRTDYDSLVNAVRGLQSTDDPSLCPLHDELMQCLQEMRNDLNNNIRKKMAQQ